MNVIIRLQNLPWSANASDIRQYFKGLQIPEGGVHIVGGENGDAFIAFRYIVFIFLHLWAQSTNVSEMSCKSIMEISLNVSCYIFLLCLKFEYITYFRNL